MNYLDRGKTIEVLLEVARIAGVSTNAKHPEDIGIAMMTAIENGAKMLEVLGKKELI